ncbi:protein of unknown function [Taphrina deformans PYCC 5710]|uniref:Pentatricopeptide repeat protein n=1 Tax=Taphrina deformans (strain PYCC 5710 / ATCC 11124 / CBS 356.35 / IMI 108563 / JCM 9778 / NBRC 8474) TaxID=1097556 RepID=R4XH53_TAPDE|nr:protein of unknown function [Taphrina deformans PYCC 5710]|eukprot:CCG82716.1 protein of unknown function [Taphrina deformans PYCC 5710]
MLKQCVYRNATSLRQLLRPIANVRQLASKRSTRAAKVWPRLAYDVDTGISRDPEVLVRSVHEKERNAFRTAMEDKDFVSAYQIYIEQRDLPILTGAEVTSLVQLISADALLRKLNSYEQPQSLQDVFWTIIEDVKEGKVAGQMMLWHHALETLLTWGQLEDAQDLWTHLQALPNRVAVDKNDANCIDSRVYASAIKLFTATGEFTKAEQLYHEALTVRQLRPSLMIDQAMISALFQNGRIGEAYKAMDRAIREQRRALRPTFFSAMVALALDAEAVGVATEIFMKGCKIGMPPSDSLIARLLAALGQSRADPLGSVLTIFRHYREIYSSEKLPIEHVNCVINAIFQSSRAGVSSSDVLSRVHQLLKEVQANGLKTSSSTVNILLAGYLDLGEHQLLQDLMSRAKLDEYSFRSILKSQARSTEPNAFSKVKNIWASFEQYRNDKGTVFVTRDLLMVMRAAFATDKTAASEWIPNIIERHMGVMDAESIEKVQGELSEHKDGRFVNRSLPEAVRKSFSTSNRRSRKWLPVEKELKLSDAVM